MPDPSNADLHDTVLFHVARAYRTLRSALAHDLVRYGLHEGRDLVLIEIARRGGSARPREIREALAMAPSSLSTILRRSEEWGYTTREPDPADARTFRAGLTAAALIRYQESRAPTRT